MKKDLEMLADVILNSAGLTPAGAPDSCEQALQDRFEETIEPIGLIRVPTPGGLPDTEALQYVIDNESPWFIRWLVR